MRRGVGHIMRSRGFVSFAGFSVSIALVTTALTFSAASAAYQPENFDSKELASGQYITLSDASFGLWSSRVTSRANSRDEILCEEFTGECATVTSNTRQISANLNLTLCSTAQEIDCVKGLNLGDQPMSLRELSGDIVLGDSTKMLPAGSGPILAQVDSDTYLLSARGEYQWDSQAKKFLARALDFDLVPVRVIPGGYSQIQMVDRVSDGSRTVTQVGTVDDCYYNTPTECFVSEASRLSGKVFSLTAQLSSNWSGFFRARLDDPEVKLVREKGLQTFTITGKPAETHKVFFKVNWDKYDTAEAEAVCTGLGSCQGLTPGSKGLRSQLSTTPAAMAILQAFSEHHMDTAAENTFEWSIGIGRSLGESCLAPNQGLIGLVSSNAPVFQSGPPSLQAGFLTYDIAGLHYASDGETLNIGRYDLQLRSDTARCLYGLNQAPVSATVQVTNENGKQVVSTTNVSEKDGWLRLSAAGFTYSKKRVKVKLTQKVNAAIAAFAGSSSTLSATQTKQISTSLKQIATGATVTCTGLYSSEANRPLALKQATSVCKKAAALKKVATQNLAAPASGSGFKSGTVLIRSN